MNLSDHICIVSDVSIVAHNGMINAFLRVIGRGNFALGTGGKSSSAYVTKGSLTGGAS